MLAVLILVAAIGSAAGEDAQPPIREGARVQVLTAEEPAATTASPGKGPLFGRVTSLQSDSLTMETSGGRVVIPFKDITRLEVSHRSRNLKRGALIGSLVGFAVVTTLCVVAFDDDDDYAISTGDSFLIGALFGAPAGGLLGLGVGALLPPWHDVPVPRTAVSKRMGVNLTLRF